MGSNLAIAARYTITLVFSERERQPRPRYTPEGEFPLFIQQENGDLIQARYRFVEMLESHHSLVVKALQKLYKFCVNKDGFPGEPLAEAPDGHPLTHAILDRLGLIKQAEEDADEPDEDSEDLRYLRLLSTSTECSATAEPSPEPATPPEPSPTTIPRSSVCSNLPTPVTSRSDSAWQWETQSGLPTNYSYPETGYQDMMSIPRSSITARDLGSNDISSHVDMSASSSVSHSHAHEQSFAYYLDGSCNGVDGQADSKPAVRMHTGIMPETHHTQMGNLSADMLNDFHFQPQDSTFYHGFTPGWGFPST